MTPVANTTLSADNNGITFQTTPSQASYWTTEFIPMASLDWLSGSFDARSMSANHNVRFRFEFYNSSKTLLGSSTQSTGFIATNRRWYYGPVQGPSGAAYFKVRFDFYSGTGTANPAAGATFQFKNVTVAKASTQAGLQHTLTNLCTNPSFETNTSGWDSNPGFGAYIPATLGRTTATALFGAASLEVTFPGGRTWANTYNDNLTIGETYTIRAFVKPPAGYTPTIDVLFNSIGSTVKNYGGGWYMLTHSFTATSTGHFYGVSFDENTTAGQKAYVDSIVLIQGEMPSDVNYFDGGTFSYTGGTYDGGYTTAWLGTTHLSASKVTVSNLPFVEPVKFMNILGSTHEINIDRNALDVGTLSATIYDASLDPAVASSIIRPGRRVRLRAYDPLWGEEAVAIGEPDPGWQSVYEGTLSAGKTNYDPSSTKKVKVTLTATDNISVLANQGENRVLAYTNGLPYILEGKGVPWNINGSGNQVANATVVAYNENASVLDQVAVTRDTNLAHAWVDRNNVLNVWDTPDIGGYEFTDRADDLYPSGSAVGYSAIDVDYSTEDCINSVTVKFLRYDVGTGQTTEIAYGPYVNQTSIDQWGARKAEFTIAGVSENPATIQTYAQSILDANSTPKVKVNSLTYPVKDARGFVSAAINDLYWDAFITYDDKFEFAPFRITGISHSISAENGWYVTYTFSDVNSVAAPTWTPSPPFEGVSPSEKVKVARPASSATLTQNQTANITSVTITSGGSGDVFVVDAFMDVRQTTASGSSTVVGNLLVNNSAQSGQAIFSSTAASNRATVGQGWVVTGLPAGTHTFLLQAAVSAGTGSYIVAATHTVLRVVRV